MKNKELSIRYNEFLRAKYKLFEELDKPLVYRDKDGCIKARLPDNLKDTYDRCYHAFCAVRIFLLMSDKEELERQYNEFFMRTHPETGEKIEIDPDQAWFWTDEWQEKEREADEDFANGRFESYDSVDEFLASLNDD